MLEDAVYYSRREADERTLATAASDPRVKQVHLLLADKYLQLARRELAAVDGADTEAPQSIPAAPGPSSKRAFPGIR